MSNAIAFTTEHLPPSERFDRYHGLYSVFTDSERLGPDFAASITAHRLSRMILYDRRLRAVGHRRTPTQARRDGFDHFTVQLNITGSFTAAVPDGERTVGPGEIILFDMARPMHSRVSDGRIITLSIGRELVEDGHGTPARLHGAVLPAGRAGLLADLMLSLTRHSADLDEVARGGASRAAAELLAVALDGRASLAGDAGRHAAGVLRRRRVRNFVDAHLVNRTLDPAAIAAALGLSRATLSRAFAPLGGVASFVQQRRLLRLRTALLDGQDGRSVAELAYAHGFTSASHLSRVFQREFGVPPRQFRTEARQSIAASPSDPIGIRFADWQRELR